MEKAGKKAVHFWPWLKTLCCVRSNMKIWKEFYLCGLLPLRTKVWNKKDYLLSTSEMARTLWLGGLLSLATLVLYLGDTPAWTKTMNSVPALSLIIDWVQLSRGPSCCAHRHRSFACRSSSLSYTGIYSRFLFSFFHNVPFCRILYLSHRVFIKTFI